MWTGRMTIWAESAFREVKVVLWWLEDVFRLFLSFLQRPNIDQHKEPTEWNSHRSVASGTTQHANTMIKPVLRINTVSVVTENLSSKWILEIHYHYFNHHRWFSEFFSPCGTFYLHIINYKGHRFDTSMCKSDARWFHQPCTFGTLWH